MGFVSRLLLVTGAIGASAWSINAQSVPRAPEAPTNAIPAGLQDIAPCTGRRLIDPCGLGALPTPRPLPPIGPGSQLGARIVAVQAQDQQPKSGVSARTILAEAIRPARGTFRRSGIGDL